MRGVFLIFSILLACSFMVSAQSFPQYTNLRLNDFAHLFSNSDSAQIQSLLDRLESDTTAQVVVVTMNTTAPDTPAEYRTKLFQAWGIGQKDKDNGLLILYSQQEHRIEVEVGYGLEGILPDSKVGSLLDQYYVPLRDQNQTVQGIIAFTKAVSQEINTHADEVRSGNTASTSQKNEVIPAIIVLVIIFFVILMVLRARSSRFAGPVFWGGGFGGGGFGGGGFGGGGFGGGGSGGGGAGR